MFDVSASELLLTVIVAIVVIGPKDLPLALRTAGRWMGKVRRVSNHFRSGIETMIREAELDEMEAKWREQNAAIMAAHPDTPPPAETATLEALPAVQTVEAAVHTVEAAPGQADPGQADPGGADPELPLAPPR
ncbi:MAG: Sec-independent protein translocase protein TatB [Novosphingobium sp.]